MSTAQRRRGRSLHLELPDSSTEDLPPVAAIFLVLFDARTGYKVAWKRSIPGLELVESVEFKSLPSGLHHVKEDLVYFIHDEEYAGVSAFANETSAETDRNALMLSVGALIPLSFGRMGKSWKHAEGLIGLASTLVKDPEDTQPLEEFWGKHQLNDENGGPDDASQPDSPSTGRDKRNEEQTLSDQQPRTRKRAISTASALAPPSKGLSSHHPAISLPFFLDTFGPLIFPLYKAALLRKRILLLGHAPVELACNFVYNISVLSGIPSSVVDLLPLEPLPTRLDPLFSVGVHDLPVLSTGSRTSNQSSSASSDPGYGWVACTTDDILAHKTNLYDTLVTLTARHSVRATEKSWPRVSTSQGSEVRATQRDYRRYRTLRRDLHRHTSAHSPYSSNAADPEASSPGLLPELNQQETFDDASSTFDEKLLEPQSWSALAYSSFMWWASAGERRTDIDEESDHDSALLRDFSGRQSVSMEHRGTNGKSPQRSTSASITMKSPGGLIRDNEGKELALIAYFHRLTSLIFRVLSDVVDSEADRNEENGIEHMSGQLGGAEHEGLLQKEKVYISSEDLTRMGLDLWSESDRQFVVELVGLYWGREAVVEGGRVECCGVRIC